MLSMIIAEQTRTTRTPAFWGYPRQLMIIHTIGSYRIPSQKKTKSKLQIKDFAKIANLWILELYTWHAIWSCLIRCANMKWIWQVLWRYRADTILSTEGQMDKDNGPMVPGLYSHHDICCSNEKSYVNFWYHILCKLQIILKKKHSWDSMIIRSMS